MCISLKQFTNQKGRSIFLILIFLLFSQLGYSQIFTYNHYCGEGALLASDLLALAVDGSGNHVPSQTGGIWSGQAGLSFSTNNENAVISGFSSSSGYNLTWRVGGTNYSITLNTGSNSSPQLTDFSSGNKGGRTNILDCSDPVLSYQISNGTANYVLRLDENGTQTNYSLSSATDNITILGTSSGLHNYQVVFLEDANKCIATSGVPSGTVSYTVYQPNVYNVTGSPGCWGSNTIIGLNDSENGVTYVLKRDGAEVARITRGSNGSFNFAAQTVTGVYTVFATDDNCEVQMTGSVEIWPALNTYTASFSPVEGTGIYCSSNSYNVTLNGSDNGATYSLYRDGAFVTSIMGDGNPLIFPAQKQAGVYTVNASNPGCAVLNMNTNPNPLEIEQAPQVLNVQGGAACEDVGVNISLDGAGGEANVTYELFLDGVSQGTRSNNGNFGLQAGVGVYTMTAKGTNGCLVNMTSQAVVNALPADVSFINTGQTCPDGEIALQTSENGVRYELYLNGVSTGSTINGTGGGITFGVKTSSGIYTVKAIVIATGCNLMLNDQLEIQPQPTVYDLTANRTTYCSSAGSSGVDLTLSGSDTGVAYQLYKNGTAFGGVRIGDGNPIVVSNVEKGSYIVRASNSGGCDIQMNYNPVITSAPAPTATIASQLPDRRCENLAGTFNITVKLTGTPPYSFNIIDDKGNTTVNVVNHNTDTYTITVNPVSTTTYHVEDLIDAANCLPQNGIGTATVYIDPVPAITFNPTAPEVCVGRAVTVTAYGAGLGGGYSWSDGLGNNQSITVAPASTHTYTVTATTIHGCVDDSSIVVTVNPLPVVDFEPPGAPPVYEYCENDPDVKLTGTPTGGGFSGTGIFPALSETFSPAHANIGNNDITYTFSDANGCVNSITKQLVVNEVPNVSIAGLAPVYCADAPRVNNILGTPASGTPPGTVGYFEIIGYGPGNGKDVFWHDRGDGTMWFDPGISLATNGADIPYTVRYTYTNLSGCTDYVETTTIVHPDLKKTVGFNGLPSGICQSDITDYNLQGQVSGVDVVTGFFTGPDPGLIDGGNNGTAVFNASLAGNGTHTITFTYTDANGCTGSYSKTITIGTDLSVNLNAAYCKSDAAVIIDGTPDGGKVTLRDDAGNIISSGDDAGNGNDVIFNPAVLLAGTYHIEYTYTDINGCDNSRIWDVNIYPLPDATFNYEMTTGTPPVEITQYCVSETSVTLTPAVVGGNFTGTAVSGNIFNPSLAGVGTHNITYTITQNGCTNATTRTDLSVVSLPSIDISNLNTSYCDNASSFTIQANNYHTPASAGESWTFSSTTNAVGVSPITDNGNGTAVFDPSVGVGSYTVTMTYVDPAQSCENSIDKVVTIYETPEVNFGGANDLLEFCQDNSSLTLTASFSSSGAPVTTGIFTGDGITDNGNGTATFDPAGLSVGDHPITYQYTNLNGCVSSRTKTFRILDYPTQYTVTGGGDFCFANNPTGIPVGLSDSEVGVNYELLLNGLPLTPANIVAGSGSAITFGDQSAPGIYTVQAVNTTSGCSVMMTGSVTIKVNDVTLVVTTTDVSCRGGNDGSATVTASGGTANYSYEWKNSSNVVVANSATASNLVADTYQVTVVDAMGCSTVTTGVVIKEPNNALSVNVINIKDVGCDCTTGSGICEGSAEVSITGGTTNYTIAWSTGGAGVIENDIEPGNHSVTVTDNNGCIVTVPFTITQLPALTIVEDITKHVDNTCNGGNIGELGVTVSGGSGDYEYSLDNTVWVNSATFTGLVAGSYDVWVRDANYTRCSLKIANPIVITEPALLTLSEVMTSHVNVSCKSGSTGQLEVLAGGGSGSYEYTIDAGANWQASPVFTGLTQGSYKVWVRDALDHGCIYTGLTAIVITEPASLSLSVVSVTDVTCNGEADGAVVLSATGGSGGYDYSIDGGVNWVSFNTFNTLLAGGYSFSVRDAAANGCQIINAVNVNINEPDDFTITAAHTDVSCFGGSDGTITVTQGQTGRKLEYSIDGASWQAGTVFSGLPAGNYKVSVRDIENAPVICTKLNKLSVDIIEPSAAIDIDKAVITDVVCNGGNTGEININVIGGTAPYTYQWTNSSGFGIGGNTGNPKTLVADNYTVVVTDVNGCSLTKTYPVTEPAPWDVHYSVTNVSTTGNNDGEINVHTISGNTSPYTITWDDDTNNHDQLRTGLTAGTYGFTVEDANGCSTVVSYIHVTEPGALAVKLTGTDVLCYNGDNGSVKVEITSGNPKYVVNWTGNLISGGTVSGTSDPAPTNLLINNLEAGTYTIDVSDAVGNTFSGTIVVDQPVGMTMSALAVKDISCYGGNNGEITLDVAGGNDPANTGVYSMIWSGPEGFSKSGTVTAERSQTGLDSPGTYHITVTDGNGCMVDSSFMITEPNELVVNVLNTKDVTCNGGNDGKIALSVSGRPAGNGYTYNWYKWDGSVWQVYQMSGTPTMINLTAGLYHAKITSLIDGCTVFSPDINVAENGALALNTTIKSISSCSGDNSGELTIDVTGGVGPFTLDYGNPADIRTGNGPFVVSGLVAGVYTVTVTDANLCTVTETYTITEPDAMIVDNVAYTIDCINDNTGKLNFTITGGNVDASGDNQYFLRLSGPGGTSYTRNVTQTDGSTYAIPFTNLPAGSYLFEVQDKLSSTPAACGYSLNFDLKLISISGTVGNTTCVGNNTGSITGVTIDGSSGNYTYLWTTSDGQGLDNSNLDQNGLSIGTYKLAITDNTRGCTVNQDFVVDNDKTLSISGLVKDVTCAGGTDGAITNINIKDAAPVVTYNWTGPGIINPGLAEQINLRGGTYQLDVVDGDGCAATETFFVNEPSPITFDTAYVIEDCDPYLRGIKLNNLTGGVGNYQFYWIGPGNANYNTKDLTGLTKGGVYTVTVSDDNNCKVTESIYVPEKLEITEKVTQLMCNGDNNGAITIDITGGVGPFVYQWDRNGIAFSTTKDIDNLTAGVYNIRVTDLSEADAGGSCEYSKAIVLTQPNSLVITGSVKHISCNGDADGKILLSVSGGTGNYSYAWSSSNGTGLVPNAKDQSGLSGGTYTVLVTDDAGCSKSQDFTVIEPDALNYDLTVTDTQCNGTGGKIQIINVTGGSGAYTYTWAGPGIEPSHQNTTYVTGLVAGDYTVTVWDAAIGHTSCYLTKQVTLTPAMEMTYSVVPEKCDGQGDGAISIDVQGGTSAYTYVWTTSNGSGIVPDAQNQGGLTEGTYNVVVTDARSCQITQDIDVVVDNVLDVVGSVAGVLCYGDNTGRIDITVSGGSGNYNYHWTGSGSGLIDGQEDQSGLSAGSYTVIVTDNVLGCKVTETYTVGSPAAPIVITVDNITNVLCKGDATGAISVSVAGGTPFDPSGTPYYSYLWTGPGDLTKDASDQTNLIAGDYNVTVTDANGCLLVSNAITVKEPVDSLSASVISVVDVTTYGGNDGEIEIQVSGGSGSYNIDWSGKDLSGKDTTLTDNVTHQTGLQAGNYNVTVTDGNGCVVAIDNIFVNQPGGPLQMVINTQDVIPCMGDNNGQISVNVTGGTLPYTITWYDSGNNQLGQVNANSATISGLAAGVYRVDVTDANSVTVSENNILIQEPAQLELYTTLVNHVSCYLGSDGKISVRVNGGATPSGKYRVEVTGPGGYRNVRTDITEATDFDYTNLASGVYNIRLTDDSNGDGVFDINDDCVVERALKIEQPEAKVTVSLDSEICIGESTQIKFVVENWADIASNNLTVTLSDGSVVVLDESPHLYTVNPVDNTVYTVTGVSNGAGCEKGYGEGTATVVVNPLPTARIYSDREICFGETATLFVDLTGAAPWTVTWTDGVTNTVVSGINTTPFSFDVTPGITTTYTLVQVQDVHCSNTGTGSATVNVNERAGVTISGNADICYGSSSNIVFDFNAGTAPYDVTLTENGVAVTLSGLIPDASGSYTYTVTPSDTTQYVLQSVTDANGCDQTVTGSALVTVRPHPESPGVITGDDLVCQGATGINYSIEEVKFATSYVWQLPAGASIVSGGGSNSITVDFDNSFTGGVIRVYAENGCAQSAISEKLINVNLLPGPAGNVSGPTALCQASTGVLYSVTAINNATGYVWTLPAGFNIVSGNGTSSIIVDLDSNVTNLTGVIRVEGVNSCGSGLPSADFNVAVTPLPVAFAGNDEDICIDTYMLQGNTPAANETGTWTILKGSGVIAAANVNNPNAPVTNLSQGENIFMWEVVVNSTGCAVKDTVVVNNNQLTVVASVEERISCDGTAVLHGTPVPAGADGGIWTFVSGNGTIVDAVNSTTSVTNLDPDQNILRWTITKHGCQSYAEVEIVNDKPDQAVISNGDYMDICSESVSLTSNSPVEGTGLWTLVSGAGVIDDATQTTIKVTGLAKGDNVLRWTIEKNGCFTVDEITVRNNQLDVDAGGMKALCEDHYQLNATVPPAGVTGLWKVIEGTGTFDDGAAYNTSVSGLAKGTNRLIWKLDQNGCFSSDTITLVNNAPTEATTGVQLVVCADTAALIGNAPNVGTGYWTVIEGSGRFEDVNDANTVVRGIQFGKSTFRWTITHEGCSSYADQEVVNNMVDVYAGKDTSICERTTVLNASTPPSGATGEWNIVPGMGEATISDINIPNPRLGGLAYGNNAFVWTITNSTCVSRDTIVVTNNSPYPANAGADQKINSDVTTLGATLAVIGTGMWSLVSGGVTFDDPSYAYSKITDIRRGPNQLRWTVEHLGCISIDEVIINNGEVIEANAGLDQAICDNWTYLEANDPDVGIGEWSVVSGAGKIESVNNQKTRIYDLGPGRNVFRWTIYYTNSSSSDTVVITNNGVSVAKAGPDRFVCGDTYVLEANIPAIGDAKWTVISGSGSFVDDTDPNTQITGLSQGANVLKYEISQFGCSSVDSVTIYNDLPTIADAGIDQTICTDSVELHPNNPTFGLGEWRVEEGSAKFESNWAKELAPGLNKLVWVITSGSCVSSDTVEIQNNQPSVAFAGHDRVVCVDSVSLSANIPQYGTGKWEFISGSGAIADDTDPYTKVTGLSQGANRFRWVIDNNGCISTDDVEISNNLIPAIAGVNQVNCADTAVLEANLPNPGDGIWGIVGGSGSAKFDENDNPYTIVRSLDQGDNLLTWTINYMGCSAIDTIVIRNDNPTKAYAGENVGLCNNNTTLAANTPTIGTGAWSLVDGGGIFADDTDPETAISDLKFGDNILRWTITHNGCASYDDIEVSFNRIDADAGIDLITCEADTLLEANSALPGIGTWSVVGGGENQAAFEDQNDPRTRVYNLAKGNNLLRWSVSYRGCETFDEVNVVNNSPSTAYAGNTQELCEDNTVLDATNVVIGDGHWEILTGAANIDNVTDPKTTVSDLSKGDNVFRWVVVHEGCSSSDDVVVTNNRPSEPYAGADMDICHSNTTLKADPPEYGTGSWSIVEGSGTLSNPTDPNAQVEYLAPGDNILRWTIIKGQCMLYDDITISNNAPTIANAGPDIQDCKDWSELDANVPLHGTGTWSVVSGNGDFDDVNDPKTTVRNLGYGENIFMWTISSDDGVCFSKDQVTIMNQVPDPSDAGSDRTICEDYVVLNANDPVAGNGTWSVISGTGDFEDPHRYDTKVVNVGFGDNVYKWTIAYDGSECFTESTVTIKSNKARPFAGDDETVYESEYQLKAANPGTLTGKWTIVAGSGDFDDDGSFTTMVRNLGSGKNTFRWTIDVDGCVAYDDVTIWYKEVPDAGFKVDTDKGCYPLEVNFTNYSVGGDVFYWEFGDGTMSNDRNPQHTYTEAGEFTVILTVPGPDGHDAVFTHKITVYDHPVADFDVKPVMVYMPGDYARMYNLSTGGATYLWDFGDGTTSAETNPSHEYQDEGIYSIQLTVQNEYGCEDIMLKEDVIEAKLKGFVSFPNAFMPRPPGGSDVSDVNAIFKPAYKDVDTYTLQIFNRWGQLIFESHDVNEGWDGTYEGNLSQQAVYVYKASGRYISGQEFSITGSVLLVR